MELPLRRLPPGREARILKMPPGPEGEPLRRLGLTEGTRIRCLRRCPLGGPGLYRVRGMALALRRSRGPEIRVEL